MILWGGGWVGGRSPPSVGRNLRKKRQLTDRWAKRKPTATDSNQGPTSRNRNPRGKKSQARNTTTNRKGKRRPGARTKTTKTTRRRGRRQQTSRTGRTGERNPATTGRGNRTNTGNRPTSKRTTTTTPNARRNRKNRRTRKQRQGRRIRTTRTTDKNGRTRGNKPRNKPQSRNRTGQQLTRPRETDSRETRQKGQSTHRKTREPI